MSMFTLAISCLTTSNLPWFMDLTFQVSMQYCSLQHQTLLPSPITSTTECCFCFGCLFILFGVISPLFSSSILDTYRPGEFHLSVSYLFAFSYCLWVYQGKNTEVVCHSLLQWNVLSELSRNNWVLNNELYIRFRKYRCQSKNMEQIRCLENINPQLLNSETNVANRLVLFDQTMPCINLNVMIWNWIWMIYLACH